MLGIEFTELLLFFRQLGFALAGASALWGYVFVRRCEHEPEGKECIVFDWLALRLLVPFLAGFILAAASWVTLLFFIPVSAHEGVSVGTDIAGVWRGLELGAVVFLSWLAFTGFGLVWRQRNPSSFAANLDLFYLIQFFAILYLLGISTWLGEVSSEQLFNIGHGVHSVFTLGTVLVLDFTFLVSQSSVILRQHLYPQFRSFSKVILLGLGMEFLSSLLVVQNGLALTDRFFFMQTVVALLVVNGAILAGPLSRKLASSVRRRATALTDKWETLGDLSGIVSVAGWLSITLVDSFGGLTLTWAELGTVFTALVLALFVGHEAVERLETQEPAIIATIHAGD